MDDIMRRLEHCEKKAKKASGKVKKQEKKHKKWKPKWVQMQKEIDELRALMNGKVDCEYFDEELEKLKDLIKQLASSGKEIKAPFI